MAAQRLLGTGNSWCAAAAVLLGTAGLVRVVVAQPEPAAKVVTIAGLTDPAAMFAARCSSCHGPIPFAPTLAQLARLTAEEIEYALWHGTMMEFARDLDSGQRVMLARWIAELGTDKGDPRPGVESCRTNADSDPAPQSDWPGWSRDSRLTRSVDDDSLTAERVAGIRLRMALPLPVYSAFEGAANPVAVVGGRLFAANNNRWIYSLDPESGCAYWVFRSPGRVRSNVAVAPACVIFGDVHANGYALEASTGRLLWQARLDSSPGARVTGNVTLHQGVAYFPVSTHQELAGIQRDQTCCSFQGSVVAIDARNGLRRWKAATIDQPLRLVGRTPSGLNRYGPSGVPVWSGIAVDDRRGLLYVTTGNQFTEPQVPESDSVIAFDLRSGAKRWVASLAPEQMGGKDIYHLGCETWVDPARSNCSPENPRGVGDRDFGAPAMLVIRADGSEVVLAASKDAMLYALDPDTGRLQWQVRVGRGGELGGVQYGFSADRYYAYLPISDVDATDFKARGAIVAVDLRDGRIAWRTESGPGACENKATPPCSNAFLSPSTAAGEVVLAGSSDGVLHAFRKSDGREIWSFDSVREYRGPNGLTGTGGSFGFGGPVVVGRRIYVMSGHSYIGIGLPGNVLLSFEVP
ncbi:MAG: hypothetical protein FJ191_13315 [Gammaproteobacteria bacterium]|nr:hypothetical protein [Gammaproteobacteria bacterium]